MLGGTPVLPEARGWPEFEGERLDFLAAVSLRAVHRELHRAPVPATGTLLFFANASLYTPSGIPIGSEDPSTKGSWVVMPSELGPAELVPPTTVPGTGNFRRCEYRLAQELTIPNTYAYENYHDLVDEDRWMALTTYLDEHAQAGPYLAEHRVGGWAEFSQSQPINIGDSWFLLLQLDSDHDDDGPGWMWADFGRLHFFLPPDTDQQDPLGDVHLHWDSC